MSTTVRANSAADIIGRLLAGDENYRISHVYLVFENTAGVPTPLIPSAGDTADIFHSLAGNRDIIRAEILPQPQLTASGIDYQTNRVTFTSVANAVVGDGVGLPFDAANNSKVIGVALVSSPTSSIADDVLYSHTAFDAADALPVIGAGQAGTTYTVTVE